MTPTPTPDNLAAVRADLHRVAVHLGTATDALRRGLTNDGYAALAAAADLVEALGEVLDLWHADAVAASLVVDVEILEPDADDQYRVPDPPAAPVEKPPVEEPPGELPPPALKAVRAPAPPPAKREPRKRRAGQVRVALPPAPQPTPAPPVAADVVDGTREMVGTVEQIGAFEVRTIGKRRFIRCPEVMCARRVILTDEQDQFEIADALHAHTVGGECLARSVASRR